MKKIKVIKLKLEIEICKTCGEDRNIINGKCPHTYTMEEIPIPDRRIGMAEVISLKIVKDAIFKEETLNNTEDE